MTCSRLTSMHLVYLGCLVNRYIAMSPNVYLVTKHFYFQLFDLAKSGNYFCWRNTLCSKFQWLDGEDILIGFRVCLTSFQIGLKKSVVTRRKRKGHFDAAFQLLLAMKTWIFCVSIVSCCDTFCYGELGWHCFLFYVSILFASYLLTKLNFHCPCFLL